MALCPEAYEEAWKHDPSIRLVAQAIFREWQENVRDAENAWGLTRMVEDNIEPDRARAIILGIMALDINEEQFGLLGAGPLEDFLNYSGPDYIGVIEELAAKNPRFRRVLSNVWQTQAIAPEVWKRVQKITSVQDR